MNEVEQMDPEGMFADDDIPLSPMEKLRAAVSQFDASMVNLMSEDPDVRIDALLDAAALLMAAKAVVLAA